ncbi:MAG: hypothetical protein KJO31_03760 [Gammaproteobacteria bacterium]|nr:hypothetical protein [Gammaproteobacteria bacterium]
MSSTRNYDTVAFDVRENASMLFFARTTKTGDIEDYLLLMRAEGEDLDDALYLEVNEQQLAGHDLVREARLTGNMLTLVLHKPAEELNGIIELVLVFDDTPENRSGIEAGAFRVLGDTLTGGHA